MFLKYFSHNTSIFAYCIFLMISVISCGGGSAGNDDPNNTINVTTVDLDDVAIGSSNSMMASETNLELTSTNIGKIQLSTDDARMNPFVTLTKESKQDSNNSFTLIKDDYEIIEGTDYEVTITSSLAPTSTIKVQLNVPRSLFSSHSDNTALVLYIEIKAVDPELTSYIPIKSFYYSDTNFLEADIPIFLFFEETKSTTLFKSRMKIALVNIYEQNEINILPKIFLPENGDTIATNNSRKIICPVSDQCIETSRFGQRMTTRGLRYHNGIDFRARDNSISLIAVTDGVVKIKPNDRYNTIELISTNSNFKYLHASEITVENGDKVKKGDYLGKAGMTGASYPHLHFQMREVNFISYNCETYLICEPRFSQGPPIDPFPFIINSLQLEKKSNISEAVIGDIFELELIGSSIDGKKVSSEINNSNYLNENTYGKIREIEFSDIETGLYGSYSEEIKIIDEFPFTIGKKPNDRNKITIEVIDDTIESTIMATWEGLNDYAEYTVANLPITVSFLSGPPPNQQPNGEYEYWAVFSNTGGGAFSYEFTSTGTNYQCIFDSDINDFIWITEDFDSTTIIENAYAPPVGQLNSIPYYIDGLAYVFLRNGFGGRWTDTISITPIGGETYTTTLSNYDTSGPCG